MLVVDSFDEEVSEVLDAVFEAFEFDLAFAGVEGCRDFHRLDVFVGEHGNLDFFGEGHTVVEGCIGVDLVQCVGAEDPHTRLGVTDVGEEQDVQGEVEGKVAEAVFEGHGTVFEVGEAIGGDEV